MIDVEGKLEELLEALMAATDEFSDLAQEAAEAESDYKLAHARALLMVEGRNAEEREANAMMLNLALYNGTEELPVHLWSRLRVETAAVRDSQQEKLRSIRAAIDACRTLNANTRVIV